MAELDLQLIAARLEGLEETIISAIIERAQFLANPVVYEAGNSGFVGGESMSLLEVRLKEQETMDARFGRYRVPEERPFCDELPESCREVNLGDVGLAIADLNAINLTDRIRQFYLASVALLCEAGDDRQYGSSVVCDVAALQALSARIHYGSFYVAEAKFRGDPEGYSVLIEEEDRDGLLKTLRRPEVEERIVERVRDKVAYQQAQVNRKVRRVIDPEL
ncbi:MAG: chorismate mutase family protein, partial [Planctomycetota bacterium]